jgi:serine/threonine protein kinase/sugar lactone lactonase YvrE
MAPTPQHLTQLSEPDRLALESRLVDFDLTWTGGALDEQARALSDPRLRRAALIEMIKIDLERRWRQGARPRLEEYLARYPELGGDQGPPADLLWSESQVRGQFGEAAGYADYAVRFPDAAAALRPWFEPATSSFPTVAGETALPAATQSNQGGPVFIPAAQHPTPLPQRIGRYHIERLLGRGGMGTVYLAHDPELDRKVAIKVPQPEMYADAGLRERFLREARAAAALDHPHLCRIYDVGRDGDTLYLAIALVEGRSLAERLREGPLPIADAVTLVRTAARAVGAAHGRGVVHRDLKPGNIMVTPDGQPVVMDFGLARREASSDTRLTRTGSLLGTPAYLPPENLAERGAGDSRAGDIFSLGVVLYEALTGRLPFDGTLEQVLDGIRHHEPIAPRRLRPEISPALESVVLRALAKDPRRRWTSMEEFAAALDRAMRGKHWLWPALGAAALAAAVVVAMLINHDPDSSGSASNAGVSTKSSTTGAAPPVEKSAEKSAKQPPEKPALPIVVKQGRRLGAHEQGKQVIALAFDPEGRLHSGGEDLHVRRWDVAAGAEAKEFAKKVHPGEGWILFAADGRRCLVYFLQVTLFDLDPFAEITKFQVDTHVGPAGFAADGRQWVVSSTSTSGDVRLKRFRLDRAIPDIIPSHERYDQRPDVIAVSPDGNLALTAGNAGINLWDLPGAKLRRSWQRINVACLAFLTSGKQFLSGDSLGDVTLWDADGAEERVRFKGHLQRVNGLALSEGGRRLLTVSTDKTARLWDVAGGSELARFEGAGAPLTCAALSPDGAWAAAGARDGSVWVWPLADLSLP